jgi:multiple sugar transport system permease protein
MEGPTRLSTQTRRPVPRSFAGLGFVLPSLSVLVLVVVVPIGMTVFYSFTDYSILSPAEPVGIDNYSRLLADKNFGTALWQTIAYTLVSVPLQTAISLAIAAALARRHRGRFGQLIRSALFIPVISSLVLVGTVWRFLLGTDDGVLNQLLGVFGIPAGNWLGEPTSALIAVALVTVWKNIGYFLVIYYAAVMEIPGELYEASAIDGAGGWRQFLSITLPSLRPVTFLVIVLGTIWSFQVFDLVYTMTGGGPAGGTETLVLEIYDAAFANYQMGYASAMAVVLFVIVLVISIAQRAVLQRGR